MPTYVYKAEENAKGCETCSGGFEIDQGMKDDPLKECPHCGAKIRRVITAVHISTSMSTKEQLSDKNLKRHGFTKLVNEGEGKFRKI